MSAELRDAATLALLRDAQTAPRLLMGTRGAAAAFMPHKLVFPGGAVEPGDGEVPLAGLDAGTEASLARAAPAGLGPCLAAAAIRELFEETGLVLGRAGSWPAEVPEGWADFAATGHVPSAEGFAFIFRAITPAGRPRRFDARFFLCDATRLAGGPDDFSGASGELGGLEWVPLAELGERDLPFVTRVVAAEIAARLPDLGPPAAVPFFRNRAGETRVDRL